MLSSVIFIMLFYDVVLLFATSKMQVLNKNVQKELYEVMSYYMTTQADGILL